MSRPHAYQCDYPEDKCTCGVTGPRVWWMDLFPEDRAPTMLEFNAAVKKMWDMPGADKTKAQKIVLGRSAQLKPRVYPTPVSLFRPDLSDELSDWVVELQKNEKRLKEERNWCMIIATIAVLCFSAAVLLCLR